MVYKIFALSQVLIFLKEYFVGSSYIEIFYRINQPIWNNKQPNVFTDFDDLFGML